MLVAVGALENVVAFLQQLGRIGRPSHRAQRQPELAGHVGGAVALRREFAEDRFGLAQVLFRFLSLPSSRCAAPSPIKGSTRSPTK